MFPHPSGFSHQHQRNHSLHRQNYAIYHGPIGQTWWTSLTDHTTSTKKHGSHNCETNLNISYFPQIQLNNCAKSSIYDKLPCFLQITIYPNLEVKCVPNCIVGTNTSCNQATTDVCKYVYSQRSVVDSGHYFYGQHTSFKTYILIGDTNFATPFVDLLSLSENYI